jgi:hypothetical protein
LSEYKVAVPRVTIPAGQGRFDSFTSPGADCAIAAAGVGVAICPVFVLVDHRQFSKKDGSKHTDSVKLWIPRPGISGLMKTAIETLCEDLECDADEVDLRNYELRITKTGTGRGSNWALNFFSRNEKPWQAAWNDPLMKFMGIDHLPTTADYRAFMAKILAPNPKYMISRGGVYHKPVSNDSQSADASDDVPY